MRYISFTVDRLSLFKLHFGNSNKILYFAVCFFLQFSGYFSWRNSSRGSWFIQALNEVLKEHAHELDLMTMMTRVNKKVAYEFESNASKEFMNRKKQIPCITSMLTKDVYLRPK